MALVHASYFSRVLGTSRGMDVILPERADGRPGAPKGPHPVLWLLHGGGDDHTIWQRRTSIERYVEALGLAVVMPSVDLSFYTNMEWGPRFFDHIVEELPDICGEFFSLSRRREDNAVAGLSMGGYGALKIGLSRPGRFGYVGCFSAGNFMAGPAPDLPGPPDPESPIAKVPELVFGLKGARSLSALTALQGSEHDLFHLADAALRSGAILPRVFHACGTEDFLLPSARLTRDYFRSIPGNPFGYEYHEGRGGHTWEFWDEWIQRFLKWLVSRSR